MTSKTSELNNLIKNFDKTTSDSIKIEQYARYFKSSVELLASVKSISSLSFLSSVEEIKTLDSKSEPYFYAARQIADLTLAINRKRYAQMVNQLLTIYTHIYSDPAAAAVETNNIKLTKNEKIALADELLRANGNDKVGTITAANTQVAKAIDGKDPEVKQAKQTSAKLIRYGAFMANMIDAKKSEDVTAAIESAVLPVGSASIKRKTNFNVAINAYLGLFTGSEIIKGVDENKPFKFNSYGITAPIGVSLSKGNSLLFIPIRNSGLSSSFFISLVDLGAVAAYRFKDDKTEQVPTIKLSDIFSPGLFYSLGIPKTPISINFGAQTGPNLRKVTTATNDYSKNTYIRYSVSVCVDIPLLNLYTKSSN